MKKIIFAGLALVASANTHAAEWATYAGCYEPISRNGEDLNNPNNAQSLIFRDYALFQEAISRRDIPAVNIILFTGVDSRKKDQGLYLPVLLSKGTRASLEDGAEFSFSGKLYHRDVGDFNAEVAVKLTEINSTEIEIAYQIDYSTRTDHFADFGTFRVRETECHADGQGSLKVKAPF